MIKGLVLVLLVIVVVVVVVAAVLVVGAATRKAGEDGVKAALEAIMAQAIADVNTNFILN